MKIGEIIKNYRTQNDLSQRAFAKKCGVSFGYVSMLESGKNPRSDKPLVPALTVLNKLAIGMGITIDQLIDLADDMDISLATPRAQIDFNISDASSDLFAGLTPPKLSEILSSVMSGMDDAGIVLVMDLIEEVNRMDSDQIIKLLTFARFINSEK